MRKLFTLFCITTLLLGSITTQAQSIIESVSASSQLKLKKVDSQHNELAFTIEDAIQLVRFFTSKNDIVAACKSDLVNNTLKVTGHEGIPLSELLLETEVNSELLTMGYFVEVEGQATIAAPAVSSNNPRPLDEDCDECTEVKVNKNLVDYVMDKANNGGDGELIFDFDSDGFNDPFGSYSTEGSSSSGVDNFMISTENNSTLNLDSLQKVINKVPIQQDLEIIEE